MTLVLIADDDFLIVELVREALEPMGYIVGAVDDGDPVVALAEKKRPELIILDCGMPVVSGIEALRKIRLSKFIYDTPVLMLTGRRGDADEDIAMRAGANDYLRKPFDPDQLAVRAEALIARSRASRAIEAGRKDSQQQRRTGWGVR